MWSSTRSFKSNMVKSGVGDGLCVGGLLLEKHESNLDILSRTIPRTQYLSW